jgi:NCS1 family nucleobase:cation symporter-1
MAGNSPSNPNIESHHIEFIPDGERKGVVWKQGPFWFLGNFQPFTVAIGLIGPALGLSLKWAILAEILGVLFGTLFMAAHAAQGPRLGLPQMVQSRAQFGYSGVIFPLVATVFTFVAFNIVDAVLLKIGLHGIFKWNESLVVVVMTVIALVVAIYGHDWLHRIFQILFWASLPLWAILTIGIFSHHAGATGVDAGRFSWVGFISMFAISASYNITYAPYVSDYSRYLPANSSQRKIITAVFLGAAGSPIWLMPIGSWLAIRLHSADALTGMQGAGNAVINHMGSLLAILSVGALVATMGMNAYSGMLSLVTMIDSVRPVASGAKVRIYVILLLGVIWIIPSLAFGGSSTTALNNSLLVMLYVLAPWTSVNLVDFYFVRHGKFAIADFFTPSGIYGRWGYRGITAYLVGLAAELPFINIPGVYLSPGSKWLQQIDISWIIGLAVGGLLYLVLSRSLDLQAEAVLITKSNAEFNKNGVVR